MSRSYRRPYAPVTTVKSAKEDKRLAHRGERRAQNHALRTAKDYEDLVIPVKRECAWNDPWSWGRDGKQYRRDEPKIGEVFNRWYAYQMYGFWRRKHPDFETYYAGELADYRRLLRK